MQPDGGHRPGRRQGRAARRRRAAEAEGARAGRRPAARRLPGRRFSRPPACERVLVSCAAGQEALFGAALRGLGRGDRAGEEPEPLGSGGGLRSPRRAGERGTVFALNGDELLDVDFTALIAPSRATGAAATIAVTPLRSAVRRRRPRRRTRVIGFAEAPRLPYWVNCGLYVLGEEALERLPERGDHERTTFPELAAEGSLRAFRHEGIWLTVNTPKELRRAEEYLVGDQPRLDGRAVTPVPVAARSHRRVAWTSRGATSSSRRSPTTTAARCCSCERASR